MTMPDFTFRPDPPCCTGDSQYVTGNMNVSVPFMDLEQAEEVAERINAGESPHVVVQQVVGQPPPDRIWTVNYDPAHPAVDDADALSGADCHRISDPR